MSETLVSNDALTGDRNSASLVPDYVPISCHGSASTNRER